MRSLARWQSALCDSNCTFIVCCCYARVCVLQHQIFQGRALCRQQRRREINYLQPTPPRDMWTEYRAVLFYLYTHAGKRPSAAWFEEKLHGFGLVALSLGARKRWSLRRPTGFVLLRYLLCRFIPLFVSFRQNCASNFVVSLVQYGLIWMNILKLFSV
jgi:hypothetical protein